MIAPLTRGLEGGAAARCRPSPVVCAERDRLDTALPARLRRLSWAALPGGTPALVADDPPIRLLGLAGLDDLPAGCALLIPRCSSVHTFGMRFPLDVEFLDADGRPLRSDRNVPPGRLLWCRGAAAVLERRAG